MVHLTATLCLQNDNHSACSHSPGCMHAFRFSLMPGLANLCIPLQGCGTTGSIDVVHLYELYPSHRIQHNPQQHSVMCDGTHAQEMFALQIAFVAGTEYTTVQLISTAVSLCTQIRGNPYTISPAMVHTSLRCIALHCIAPVSHQSRKQWRLFCVHQSLSWPWAATASCPRLCHPGRPFAIGRTHHRHIVTA